MKWLPGASKEFHSSVCDVSPCTSVCVILNQCSPRTRHRQEVRAGPGRGDGDIQGMVGTWSRAELVTEGESVKLRQERDVTQAVALLAAAAVLMDASFSRVDARTDDLSKILRKMNGTNK